jgi:hypothetical protein
MRGLQINGGQSAPQPMLRDHLVRPIKSAEMIFIKLARLRRAQGSQDTGRISAEDQPVRHICKASHSQ